METRCKMACFGRLLCGGSIVWHAYLLLVIAACAAGCGGTAQKVETVSAAEQAAIGALRKAGANVQCNGQGFALAVSFKNMKVRDADLQVLRQLSRLESLDLGFTGVTNAQLEQLYVLQHLKTLNLARARITDAGLKHLKGLTELKNLRIPRTRISSAGLAHLKDLTALEELRLPQTNVSDAGLVHLEQLPNLKLVLLKKTFVTDRGVARLQQALPKAKIQR